jgi:hypothetical protein
VLSIKKATSARLSSLIIAVFPTCFKIRVIIGEEKPSENIKSLKSLKTESRTALREFIELLEEVGCVAADPDCDNWIDSQGRALEPVFWRFFLPEEEVETPTAEVVKFAELLG